MRSLARRAHHNVGKGAGHAQVDFARNRHVLRTKVVVPDDLKTADLTADLFQEQAKLPKEVDLLGGLLKLSHRGGS
jgi:hypothetical protein